MDRNFARALPLVLAHEGGFVNLAEDPGGATNKGVTLATFRAYVKPNGTIDELKAITDAQVATVYYRHYWSAVNAQALPSGIDYAVFDFAVNSGPARAAKYLQGVLGVAQDGRVGPQTIAAVEKANARDVIDALCDERLGFLKRIKHKGKLMWETFGKGWSRRVADVRKTAQLMVGHPADVKEVVREISVQVAKPVVPASVDQEVKRQTNGAGWFTSILTGGAAGAGAIFGADWTTVLAIGGVGLVSLVLLFLFRHRLLAAINEVRAGWA